MFEHTIHRHSTDGSCHIMLCCYTQPQYYMHRFSSTHFGFSCRVCRSMVYLTIYINLDPMDFKWRLCGKTKCWKSATDRHVQLDKVHVELKRRIITNRFCNDIVVYIQSFIEPPTHPFIDCPVTGSMSFYTKFGYSLLKPHVQNLLEYRLEANRLLRTDDDNKYDCFI